MTPGFVCVVVFLYAPFLLMTEEWSVACVDCCVFMPSPVGGQLDGFQVGAVTDKAALNMWGPVFVWIRALVFLG